MNFEQDTVGVCESLARNQPKQLGKPATPRVHKTFTAKYFGFALCKNGDNNKLLSYASRALEAVLRAETKAAKVTVEVTSDQVTMTTTKGERVAVIPIAELRSFARHQSDKTAKPKMITLMALNRFNEDKHKPYQCFMIMTNTTADADALCDCINMAFNYASEYKRMLEEKRQHDSKLAKLPGSPRLVRVGWS